MGATVKPGASRLLSALPELRAKFVARTHKELLELRLLLQRVGVGDRQAIAGMQQLAHRIYGSGSLLKYEEIGARAAALERACQELVARPRGTGAMQERLQHLTRLIDELERAALSARDS